MRDKKVLVISAHAADYVWRSGGTIAKYVKHGAEVQVLVLSFGVRGESNDLWDEPGQTAERVKAIRRAETTAAAEVLGVKNLEFWDYEDYPFVVDAERLDRLIVKMRRFNPSIVVSHDKTDIMNPDHSAVCDYTQRASVMAISNGVRIADTPTIPQMAIYGFEPHQTELSDYAPDVFIDITETYEAKVAAMNCFKAQKHLIEYYTQRAFMRGNHARRLSGRKDCKYAESFASRFPVIAAEFPCR